MHIGLDDGCYQPVRVEKKPRRHKHCSCSSIVKSKNKAVENDKYKRVTQKRKPDTNTLKI